METGKQFPIPLIRTNSRVSTDETGAIIFYLKHRLSKGVLLCASPSSNVISNLRSHLASAGRPAGFPNGFKTLAKQA
jgi:hypothetical protein